MKFKLYDRVVRKGDPDTIGTIAELNYLGEKDIVSVRFPGGETFVDIHDLELAEQA